MKESLLEFKWTVSRGRDTYGYNICSLYVNGQKVSSCNGGGYDMEGTALGNWIARAFKNELLKLKIPMHRRNGQDVQEYYGLSFHDPNYGASSKVPTERHTVPLIDGACGKSSVENILNAIGLELVYLKGTRNLSLYRMIEKQS
ncbi:MAG: hypothetical protein EHM49_05270 [Deltaproteobacteria bacterium]|nr:MAG: hypothetical protein EHM49_05270 [Deltaproteobacteria bacterium]